MIENYFEEKRILKNHTVIKYFTLGYYTIFDLSFNSQQIIHKISTTHVVVFYYLNKFEQMALYDANDNSKHTFYKTCRHVRIMEQFLNLVKRNHAGIKFFENMNDEHLILTKI